MSINLDKELLIKLNDIQNKDDLIKWLASEYENFNKMYIREYSTSSKMDRELEIENQIVMQKINKILNNIKSKPISQIEKEILLQSIIDSYEDINDHEHTPKNQDEYDIPNTEKEEKIMQNVWLAFIDHLYIRDLTLFSHLYVLDNKVYAHFSDAPLDADVELKSTLTKDDFINLKIELAKKLTQYNE